MITAETDCPDTASDQIQRLKAENARLQKVVGVLMDASERTVSVQGTDYGLFSTTVLLEERVRERTNALERALTDLRHSNHELEQVKEEAEHARYLLSTAISAISEGFALFDENDRLLLWNRPYQELWSAGLHGLTLEQGIPYERLLHSFCDHGLVSGDCDEWIAQRMKQHASGLGSLEFELSDGRWIKVGERRLENGGSVGVYTDITDVRSREEAIREAELAAKSKLLQASLDSIPQGISVFNRENQLVAWNDRFISMLQIPESMVSSGADYEEFLRYDWGPGDRQAIYEDGRLRPTAPCVHERKMSDGIYIEIVRQPMPDGGFVSTYTDISSKKEAAEYMQHLATHDSLTGIANRTLLMETLTTELAHCRRRQTKCAVLFMDLNKFKPINDEYGHDVGDKLLQLFASRLEELIREGDMLARIGGDEFSILLSDVSRFEDISRLVRRIHQAISIPFVIEDLSLQTDASIGIAIFPEHGQSGDILLRNADLAMYHAKRHGTGHQMFNENLSGSDTIPSTKPETGE